MDLALWNKSHCLVGFRVCAFNCYAYDTLIPYQESV